MWGGGYVIVMDEMNIIQGLDRGLQVIGSSFLIVVWKEWMNLGWIKMSLIGELTKTPDMAWIQQGQFDLERGFVHISGGRDGIKGKIEMIRSHY